jgi:hypothetical protein
MLRPVGILCLCCYVAAISGGGQPNPRQLTEVEAKAIHATAEKALKDRDLWKAKIYLTNTEVVLDQSANPPQRYALLTFYRYEGNLAILATIQLETMTATKVVSHAHRPTSLAPAEIKEAERIAREHPQIKLALAKYKYLDKIEVDTIVAQIINPEVPGYQHRVARLFFRDEKRNYLPYVPMVDVDLTTGDVRFDLIRGMHGKTG